MKRENSPVRPDFAEHAAEIGFTLVNEGGAPAWDESARYVFSLGEVEELEAATAEMHALCQELVDRVAQSEELMRRLRIPHHAFDVIAESWARRDPSLYGRFDFAYDGAGPPKLLDYNADAPANLVESSVVQWHWLEQLAASGVLPQHVDQFNSLHERLVARFADIGGGGTLHFAGMSNQAGDLTTVSYLEECARAAGLATSLIDIRDIGLSPDEAEFLDRRGQRIGRLFKLYAWERMFADPFGRAPAMRRTRFIEPPWKMILSNKGTLALLWQMAPNHPNLLPCFFEEDGRAATLGETYARKPIFSGEGAKAGAMRDGARGAGEKDAHGREGFVRQALRPLPQFDGRSVVLGCWLVGDAPAGLGLREEASPTASRRARFVPHVIL